MDFDKFDNLSKRIVKLILKIFSDLEPLGGSSNKKTLYSTRFCVIWAFFGARGPLKLSFHSSFKLAHSCQKKPKLHTNSLNKLLFFFNFIAVHYYNLIVNIYTLYEKSSYSAECFPKALLNHSKTKIQRV
jgi:hypothetical protein